MVKRYNVVTKKVVIGNDGAEKAYWNTVGKLIKFDATESKPEGFAIELYMFPETRLFVFDDEKREKKAEPQQQVADESIPF